MVRGASVVGTATALSPTSATSTKLATGDSPVSPTGSATPAATAGAAARSRRYRGVSGDERRADRRRRLLEAGLQLLGTVGWEQTTMTAVCAEARLTERYFYESFRNREQLLLAVLDGIA